MTKKYFNSTLALSYGWSVMKANLGFFIGLGFLFMAINHASDIALMILGNMNLPESTIGVLRITIQIVGQIISIFIGIGLMKIAVLIWYLDQI